MPRRTASFFPLLLRAQSSGTAGDSPLPVQPGWKRVQEATAYTLILLGFLVLTLVPGVSGGVLLAATLLLIPSAILSRQPNPPLYTRAWNLATLLFMAASLVFARWNQSAAILTLAHLCIFLQIHKAYNYRAPRDYFQIWTLTLMLFLLVPLCSRTPPLLFGFLLIGFLGVSVWHFGALGWRADVDVSLPTATPAPAGAPRHPVPIADESDVQRSSTALRAAWRRLALAGLAISLVGFFCLPRPVLPPALRRAESAEEASARQSLITGLSQSIDLRQISSLHLDDTEALQLRGSPLLRMGSIRLRAGTLDWFDGDRWEHTPNFSGGLRLPRHPTPPEFRLGEQNISPADARSLARIQVNTKDFNYRGVLTLPGTVGVGGVPGQVWLSDDGSLMTQKSPAQYALYVRQDTLAGVRTETASRGDGPSDQYLQLYTRLRTGWLEAMANRITGGATSDLEKARRIETYLKRQGEYTLDLRKIAGGDGVAVIHRFLTSPRPEGHCELFATGMALLCRAIHLPSRVVTGFYGGVYNETEGKLIMRYCDAHAWVEVWIPTHGWMTFDPTPPSPLVSFSDRLPFLQIRQWMGGILAGWQRLAVGYGGKTQRFALQWLGKRMEGVFSFLAPLGGEGRVLNRISESVRQPLFRWVAAALLALNLAVIGFWRRRGRRSGLFPSTHRSSGQTGNAFFWLPLRETLATAAGAPRPSPPPGLTFEEYLAYEARRNGVPWDPLAAALTLYQSRRFGARKWTPEDARRFDEFLTPLDPTSR